MKDNAKNATVALHMIVKDEVDAVFKLINEDAVDAFDTIYLTFSDKKAASEFKKRNKSGVVEYKNIHVDQRDWNDRFDDARNHNWALGKEKYGFWVDSDDQFDFSVIPKLVELAEQGNYDAVWLPYEYAHDEYGNCIALHWRERLVRRDKGFTWRGWVHENLLTDEPFTSKRVNIPVIHRSTHKDESEKRNHEILKKAYEETKDPRYIHYLGISYYGLGEWEKAIEVLKEYVSVGGWDEEIYRSLIRMSEASNNLGRGEDARQYILRAIGLLPSYPQAYFNLAQLEFEDNNFEACLEWLKVAFTKPEPEGASVTDPTISDRARLLGALSEFQLGNYREALELLKQVETMETQDILPEFEREASIDRLAAILPALLKHYQAPDVLWAGLKDDLKYDNRFRKVREAVTEPRKWGDNSVVFFCGKGYEEWGPHTLDNGMGGSEEAVVYLSRELAKLGYDVTVFGEIRKDYIDSVVISDYERSFVRWLPWTHIDKRDQFSTLVIWRYPQFAPQFKARKKIVDVHDLLPSKIMKPYKDVTYSFKTQWFKDQYPQITDYRVVGNGIDKQQFAGKKDKKYGSVIWTSAYYRGLECLVDLWPKIKKQVPEAELSVYYGWQSWVSAEGEDEFYHRMTRKLKEAEKLGVKEYGRVSHETIAEKMNEAQVWAYPTQFPEIHCITALKAQEAECWPVVTNVAALNETVQSGDKIESQNIYADEYKQEKFVEAVVAALKEKKRGKPVDKCDWSTVAKSWKKSINEN